MAMTEAIGRQRPTTGPGPRWLGGALVLIALLATACSKSPALGSAGPEGSATPAVTSQQGERLVLRVLTFNAFVVPFRADHQASRDRLGPAIGELQADLVALQEVWRLDDAELLARSLDAQGLSYQRWLASSAPLAYGSPGLLVASRYPLGPSDYRPYVSGTLPITAWHPDWFSGKGVVAVEVRTPLGSIDFVNTHLHASYATYDYFDVRLGQAAELLDYIGSRSSTSAGRPLILAGDLNSPPDELPARLLRSGAGLLAVPAAGIDTILVRQGQELAVDVLDSRRVLGETVSYEDGSQGRLSDHDGVLAEIALSRRTDSGAGSHTDTRDWPAIASEGLAAIEQAHGRLGWQNAGAALLAFLLVFAFLRGGRHALRQRGWPRRLWLLGSLGALSLGLWSGYFALIFGPAELVWLERAHDTVERMRKDAADTLVEIQSPVPQAREGEGPRPATIR